MDVLSFGDHNYAMKAENKLNVRIDDYPAELCPFSDSDDEVINDIHHGHTDLPDHEDIRSVIKSGQTENSYPAGLCPFSDTEDDPRDEEIPIQKIVKENSYPAGLFPFSDTEDELSKEEISVQKTVEEDYPEHLNPFADGTENIQKKKQSFGKKRRAPQPPASHWDPDGYMVLFCRGQEE